MFPHVMKSWRKKFAACASATALSAMGLAAAVQAAEPDASVDAIKTATPIKHVIIIVGENRSFDHVFATYVPKNRGKFETSCPRKSSTPMALPGRGLPRRISTRSPQRRMTDTFSAARISRTRRSIARCPHLMSAASVRSLLMRPFLASRAAIPAWRRQINFCLPPAARA